LPPGQRLHQLAVEAVGAATPVDALRTLRELKLELDAFERWQVALALAVGSSFAAIARELGLSRQAVHRRYRGLAGHDALISPAAQRILRSAGEQARALGSGEIASEHTVLAVLGEPELAAGAVLHAAGATLERARRELGGDFGRPKAFARPQLDVEALDRRIRRGRHPIEVEDLLLAGLSDPDSGASRLLRALGVDVDRVRRDLLALAWSYPGPAPAGRWPRDADRDG
jgi:ATP-dependent Clp protease ATP-binding subunit ClpA